MAKSDGGVSVGDLAKVFGVDARRVQQLAAEGHIPRSSRGKYPLIPCVMGYIRYLQQSVQRRGPQELLQDTQQQNLLLLTERTRKQRLENDLREGQLIPAADVEIGIGKILQSARSRLLNLPSKAANRLNGVTDGGLIKQTLTELSHEILDDIAQTPVFADTDAGCDPENLAGYGPAANDDRQRVGGQISQAKQRK
jgi:phage terminase Nu1 subunit (DNA packaging protein)